MKHPLCVLLVAAAWIAPAAMPRPPRRRRPRLPRARSASKTRRPSGLPGGLAISRDGKQVAYALEEQVFVVPLAGGGRAP